MYPPGSRLKKECATACLQAVLLLLGKSTACKQAVAHIVDELAVFQRAANKPSKIWMKTLVAAGRVGARTRAKWLTCPDA